MPTNTMLVIAHAFQISTEQLEKSPDIDNIVYAHHDCERVQGSKLFLEAVAYVQHEGKPAKRTGKYYSWDYRNFWGDTYPAAFMYFDDQPEFCESLGVPFGTVFVPDHPGDRKMFKALDYSRMWSPCNVPFEVHSKKDKSCK